MVEDDRLKRGLSSSSGVLSAVEGIDNMTRLRELFIFCLSSAAAIQTNLVKVKIACFPHNLHPVIGIPSGGLLACGECFQVPENWL